MLKLRLFALAVAVLTLGGAVNPLFAAPMFEPRSSDAAGVSIVVKPKSVEAEATVWDFDVTMNTHIKPLSENLTAVSVLVDSNGRRTKPIAWQGDKPGGHHRRGVLQFPAPAEAPATFELQSELQLLRQLAEAHAGSRICHRHRRNDKRRLTEISAWRFRRFSILSHRSNRRLCDRRPRPGYRGQTSIGRQAKCNRPRRPGYAAGAPGMGAPGIDASAEPYGVVLFGPATRTIYMRFEGDRQV